MMTARTCQPSDSSDGWFAGLELGFSRQDAGTVLTHNRHRGPLRLQRPLYPEPGVCHAVILHPPGGVAGGDRLEIQATVGAEAAALVTTPGATKFYRSDGATARQTNSLMVDAGGCLEWLPQETIVYPGAHAKATTRLNLNTHAVFMGWEILCLGLPACDKPFTEGHFTTGLEINRDGRPIFRDRLAICEGDDIRRPAGMRGFSVSATFVATGVAPDMPSPLRELIDEEIDTPCGITLMDDLLVIRLIGHKSAEVKSIFQAMWRELRPKICRREACAPRIWET
jgi:urease accessory protein